MDFFDIARKVAGELMSEVVSKNGNIDSSVGESRKSVAQWDNGYVLLH